MVLICNSQMVSLGKLNGLYIACYNIQDREWLVYLSRWSVYASGRLDKLELYMIMHPKMWLISVRIYYAKVFKQT